MPGAIGTALAWIASNAANFIGFSVAAQATIAQFAASLGSAVFGLGLSVAGSLLSGRGSNGIVSPSDGQQSLRQALPPRIKYDGINRVGGPVWWFAASLSAADKWYQGTCLNHGRIGAILEYLIDGKLVEIDGAGLVTTPTYVNDSGAARVSILTRLGAASETKYAEINAEFHVDNCRGDGVATALIIADPLSDAGEHYKLYPNGVPTLRITHDGSVRFDPRDPAQSAADPTTWQPTTNAVIATLGFVMDPDGLGIDYATAIAPNIAAISALADLADEAVALAAGGSEPRYAIAGGYDLTADPVDALAGFLSAWDGRVWVKADGTIGFAGGAYVNPTVTIGDAHIVAYTLTGGRDPFDKIGGIRARYLSVPDDYSEQDADPWPSAAAVAGADDRAASMDLRRVPSHAQARRLMKREYLRQTAPFSGRIVTDLYGLKALDERFVAFTISEFGLEAMSFEIARWTFDPSTMTLAFDVTAVGPEIDVWDAASEEGTAPTVPAAIPPQEINLAPLTKFGNLTSGGGLAAAFDGVTSQFSSDSASSSSAIQYGYAGVSFATPQAIARALIYGSSTAGFINATNFTFTARLYAKTGAAPASALDGTELVNITIADTGDESAGHPMVSSDFDTLWDHVWIVLDAAPQVPPSANWRLAELRLFAI